MKSESSYAAALAALPLLGPHRLRKLLSCHVPSEAWAVVRGDHRAHSSVEALFSREFLGDKLRERATDAHVQAVYERCIKSDIHATFIGESEYPAILAVDVAAPAVLFWCGDLSALTQRRVGIIGTRAATAAGRYMASQLAHDLTNQGVAVVSGLARGIDAWAHRGAIHAALHAHTVSTSSSTTYGRPIAVVASGLDVVYPRENAQLWSDVQNHGVILSESPPGTPPEAFRFPLRNRILAALCEVLVVVESRVVGGSMITVEEAQKRDVMVMAVPGSPRTSSSAGTNLLLQQGCAPVVDVADVLVALGLDHRRCFPNTFDPRHRPSDGDHVVLGAFSNGVCSSDAFTLDQLMVRTKGDLVSTALALGRLEADGWVVNNSGWWEAVGPRRA
ncbi:MAG: DNA-processing protein DprA [Ilumatobacteraceae bacterium]